MNMILQLRKGWRKMGWQKRLGVMLMPSGMLTAFGGFLYYVPQQPLPAPDPSILVVPLIIGVSMVIAGKLLAPADMYR